MNAWVLLLLPTALGVDFGWERQPDNSIEYIVQIEPEAVDQMKTGTELISALPPQLKNIRNYRIRVGRDKLPNQNVLPPEVANGTAPTTTTGSTWGTSGQNYQTTAPGTAYPNLPSNTTAGFANTSLPNRPASTFPTPTATGTGGYYGTTTSQPTSTGGFPMQGTGTGYATTGYNASGYPQNTTQPTGYAATNPTNTNPTNTWNGYNQPTQPNYAPAGYNPQTGYATQPGYAGQPGYATQPGQQPAGYPQPGYQGTQPQYVAANPNQPGPNLADPNGYYNNQYGPKPGDPQWQGMQTAKPSIELGPPPGTTPGTNYGPNYAGSAQGGVPTGGQQFANGGTTPNPTNPQFANTAGTTPEQQQQAGIGTATANNQPQSQWASLSFALVSLFASLGANLYFGWTTYHLRERYRMMLSDRPTY
ncbi:MAG: hypothetical protein JNK76_10625 [Planctomycetales bacterium]|nr:hypothetical protein [Planctomycetales bacterium]MBN8627439.1 hypothetical protein [Planctomycetota bacterium]